MESRDPVFFSDDEIFEFTHTLLTAEKKQAEEFLSLQTNSSIDEDKLDESNVSATASNPFFSKENDPRLGSLGLTAENIFEQNEHSKPKTLGKRKHENKLAAENLFLKKELEEVKAKQYQLEMALKGMAVRLVALENNNPQPIRKVLAQIPEKKGRITVRAKTPITMEQILPQELDPVARLGYQQNNTFKNRLSKTSKALRATPPEQTEQRNNGRIKNSR